MVPFCAPFSPRVWKPSIVCPDRLGPGTRGKFVLTKSAFCSPWFVRRENVAEEMRFLANEEIEVVFEGEGVVPNPATQWLAKHTAGDNGSGGRRGRGSGGGGSAEDGSRAKRRGGQPAEPPAAAAGPQAAGEEEEEGGGGHGDGGGKRARKRRKG